MKKNNQDGMAHLAAILVVVVFVAIGVVGWKVWDNSNNNPSTQSTTPTAVTQTTSNEPAPDPNKGYLVIKQWGLRFKTPSGLTDVKYLIDGDTVAFYAKPKGANVQYVDSYEKMEDGKPRYASGVLVRSTESSKTIEPVDITVEGKKLGDYYYYTNHAFSSLSTGAGCQGLYGEDDTSCKQESMAFDLVNRGDNALLNTIESAK